MYYKSRKAAWTAAIIMQHLKTRGVLQFKPNSDGSVKFFYGGMWTTMLWNGSALVLEPMLIIKPKRGPKVHAPIVTSSQQFEQRGDKWNARNEQHNADRELRPNPTQNAFGDLCQKPTVDGYEDWGPLGYSKKVHKRLVAVEKRMPGDLTADRKFAQMRMKYRAGK
jgi:hypothetical protein